MDFITQSRRDFLSVGAVGALSFSSFYFKMKHFPHKNFMKAKKVLQKM